jgi:hypothetical protein
MYGRRPAVADDGAYIPGIKACAFTYLKKGMCVSEGFPDESLPDDRVEGGRYAFGAVIGRGRWVL